MTVAVMESAKRDALSAKDKTMLMGYEGMASNAYFGVLPILILNQKQDFPFCGRNRRPPKDAVNAMLSFAYTLIANDYIAALETVGLDPYVGFLHTLRPGRASLALDMMEELRGIMADRFVGTKCRFQAHQTDLRKSGCGSFSLFPLRLRNCRFARRLAGVDTFKRAVF